MSVRSMTGCGRGEAARGEVKVTIELSSVNHRQFDIRFNLPPGAEALETEMREQIHARIARGAVQCRMGIDFSGNVRQKGIIIDEALTAGFVRRLRRTGLRLGLRDDLGLNTLLNLPGVMRLQNVAGSPARLRPLMRPALRQALTGLLAMRAAEGAALERDLLSRSGHLRVIVAGVTRHAPVVKKRYRRALMRRIRAAGVEIKADDAQLAREVALFAERSDIMEEVTRLQSHLGQLENGLHAAEPVGRTLDFLLQEMFREINTIGSKANDAAVSGLVVRFKAELERIREQVQNVE